MRYKEVHTEYKGHKIKVMVHTDKDDETEEELQARAVEILNRTIKESVLRTLGWVNES